jgi:hypothetical protein
MTTKTVTEFDPMTQADGVANLLGREWTVRTGDWSGSRILAHPGGYRVRLYAGAGDGRLHIAGLLPAPIDEEHLRPDTADLKPGDITVALTSPPQRVAGEITRRLLPGLAEATRTNKARRAGPHLGRRAHRGRARGVRPDAHHVAQPHGDGLASELGRSGRA